MNKGELFNFNEEEQNKIDSLVIESIFLELYNQKLIDKTQLEKIIAMVKRPI